MKSGGSYKALELKYHPDKNPEICKIVCTEAMFILNKTRRRGRRNAYQ
jgi:DnaJ-class molecular chaperone